MRSLPRGWREPVKVDTFGHTRIRMISKSNAKKAVIVQFLPKRKKKKKSTAGILFLFRSVIVSRAIFDARAQLRAYSHKVHHLWNNGPVGRKTYLRENRKGPCCGVGVGWGWEVGSGVGDARWSVVLIGALEISRGVGSSGRKCREIQQLYFRVSPNKWQCSSILASISDLHKRCA